MSDNQTGKNGAAPGTDTSGGGRRGDDRRKGQASFEGPDRRKADRRSGDDRRATKRDDGGDSA